MARTKTDWIVIHCSATRPIQDIGAKEIRSWHKAKGWTDIGYHYVIRRDGTVEKGRGVDEIGSHVQGRNSRSVGVCMVGGIDDSMRAANNFTRPQWAALKKIVADLVKRYPTARVLGHRDFPGVSKECPCFDARKWAADNKLPAAPSSIAAYGNLMARETTLPHFNPSQSLVVADIKRMTEDIMEYLRRNVPENRCRSIALTNFEQAAMWAVKANFTNG